MKISGECPQLVHCGNSRATFQSSFFFFLQIYKMKYLESYNNQMDKPLNSSFLKKKTQNQQLEEMYEFTNPLPKIMFSILSKIRLWQFTCVTCIPSKDFLKILYISGFTSMHNSWQFIKFRTSLTNSGLYMNMFSYKFLSLSCFAIKGFIRFPGQLTNCTFCF